MDMEQADRLKSTASFTIFSLRTWPGPALLRFGKHLHYNIGAKKSLHILVVEVKSTFNGTCLQETVLEYENV